MARTQKHRAMAIGTPLGGDKLLLQSFSISEQLGRLFSMSLELLSEDHAISLDSLVGQNVTVRIETSRGGTRYFNGLVCSFAQRRRVGRLARYEAAVVPTPWLLTRTSDCRIFQEKKVPDIIKEVMKDHGFTDVDDRLSGKYRKWEYCVQYRETDFNFISRLMEQEGIYYFFEHSDGKHKMVLCDAPTAHKPFPGYAQVSYRPPQQATTDIEHIHDWSVEKRVQSGAYVHDDFDFKNPTKELETNAKKSRSHLGADFEIYNYPGEYTEFGDGEQYARVRIEELHSQHEVVRGASDVRGIAAGHKFTLTEYPRQDQCREYLLVSSSVTGQADEYDSQGMASGRGPLCLCSFSGIPATEPYRTTCIAPRPVIEGPQTAIVVGPKGDEIYTDKYGRVKVQFHWDRRSKADETSSCWIRVVQTWAGKKWGAIHVPRIGQEVVVEFLEGDPDRPLITGRVYNGKEMPPYELPKEKTRSGVKTNSSKGGGGYNELSMDDTKGKEQIRVHAEKDKDEVVEADSREWIGNDRHLIVKRHQKELVEEDKHLHVKGDHNEKVDGNVSLTVGSSHDEKVSFGYHLEATTIDLKATAIIRIEAPYISIKAGAACMIDGGGTLALKGGMVLINSGGVSGSAMAAKPETPEDPDAAKKDKKGEVDKPPPKPKPPKPATYSAQSTVMKKAAASGAPFCEKCKQDGGGGGGGDGGGGGEPAGRSTQQTPGGGAGDPSQPATSGGGTSATQARASTGQTAAGPEGRSQHFQPGRRAEPAKGPDGLSGVQAHAGGAAAQVSQSAGASAYASGQDVAFQGGAAKQDTAAHEATHVAQSGSGAKKAGGPGPDEGVEPWQEKSKKEGPEPDGGAAKAKSEAETPGGPGPDEGVEPWQEKSKKEGPEPDGGAAKAKSEAETPGGPGPAEGVEPSGGGGKAKSPAPDGGSPGGKAGEDDGESKKAKGAGDSGAPAGLDSEKDESGQGDEGEEAIM